MSEHTPGEWKFSRRLENVSLSADGIAVCTSPLHEIVGANGLPVAWVKVWADSNEGVVNAALIRRAPRLTAMADAGADMVVQTQWAFAALESMLDHGPPDSNVGMEMYRQAIEQSRRSVKAYEEASRAE